MDVAASLTNGLQHRLVRAGTISQKAHSVAFDQRRAADRLLHCQVPGKEVVFRCLRVRSNALPATVTVLRGIRGQARLRGARVSFLRVGDAGAGGEHGRHARKQHGARPSARVDRQFVQGIVRPTPALGR